VRYPDRNFILADKWLNYNCGEEKALQGPICRTGRYTLAPVQLSKTCLPFVTK